MFPHNHISHKFKTCSRIKRLAPGLGYSAGTPHHRVKTVIIWRKRSLTSGDMVSVSHKNFGCHHIACFSVFFLIFPSGQWLHQPQPHPPRPKMQGDGQRHPLHAGDAAERLHDHSLSHARQPHGSAPQLCEYSRTRLLTVGATLPVLLVRARAVARVAQPTMTLVRRCFTISGLQNVTSPVVSSDHVSEGGRLWPTPPHTLSVTCPFKPENSLVQ